jgi:hypothetical protein
MGAGEVNAGLLLVVIRVGADAVSGTFRTD